jgi:hypothetical protein
MLNQTHADSGIPNRFYPKSSRSKGLGTYAAMMAEKAPAYISAVRPPCKLDEKSEATLNEVKKNVADAMKLIPDVKDIERAKSDAQAARAAKNKSENINSVLI